jgi:hypothetical protein
MRRAWREWATALDGVRTVSRELTDLTGYIADCGAWRPVVPLIAYSTAVSLASLRLSSAATVSEAVRLGAAWAAQVDARDDDGALDGLGAADATNEDLACDIREWIGAAEQVSHDLARATLGLVDACCGAQSRGTGRPLNPAPVA